MFYGENSKKAFYILLALMVLLNLKDYSGTALLALILSLPAVIIAISFHEFAHAYAADKLGDDTPRYQGRLTLNPIKHLDPFGFVLLIFAGFGWGKPVQINPNNFKRDISMQKGEAIVSVAGPLMNFCLAIISAIVLCALYMYGSYSFLSSTIGNITYIVLEELVFINIGLGVFNLIPLPPLDGSKIFMNFLPYRARTWFINNSRILYIIFLVIWITGLTRVIISPIINFLSTGLMNGILAIFRLF